MASCFCWFKTIKSCLMIQATLLYFLCWFKLHCLIVFVGSSYTVLLSLLIQTTMACCFCWFKTIKSCLMIQATLWYFLCWFKLHCLIVFVDSSYTILLSLLIQATLLCCLCFVCVDSSSTVVLSLLIQAKLFCCLCWFKLHCGIVFVDSSYTVMLSLLIQATLSYCLCWFKLQCMWRLCFYIVSYLMYVISRHNLKEIN